MSELANELENPLVLIVDDDLLQRMPMREALQRDGFRVEEAASGSQAWALLHDEKPDLVIIDVEMPEMDGFALCRMVRRHANFAHLPLVMVASPDDVSAIERANRLGATDIITRPIDWTLLGDRMRYILRSVRSAQSLMLLKNNKKL